MVHLVLKGDEIYLSLTQAFTVKRIDSFRYPGMPGTPGLPGFPGMFQHCFYLENL